MMFFEEKTKSEIEFNSSDSLTLGVEIELQIIDRNSLNLTPKFDELFSACESPKRLEAEFYLSTAEINTSQKCNNVGEVEVDFNKSIDQIIRASENIGVELATTGCHPFSRYADCVITPSKRYNELIDRNQWLTRRMTVYGLHVHLGMKSGDDFVRFNNFFFYFLPHLLALSASSPFWQGENTGLSACRPTTYESLPTAGQPYKVKNWNEFESLYGSLKKCKAIDSMKDLWWDMRPSPRLGTLEIRVCDGCATLEETLAIVALVHLLAAWFEENGAWIDRFQAPLHWIIRENKWRAIRHGLDAELITCQEGKTKPIRQDISDWVEKLAPLTKKFGYEKYINNLCEILEKGNSTTRQLKVFEKTNSLQEVVKFNIAEFKNRKPIWNF